MMRVQLCEGAYRNAQMDGRMRKGCLIVNEFLHSGKFAEIHRWLMEAAGEKGIELELLTNAQCMPCIGSCAPDDEWKDTDFVLFWDKDIRLARALENRGIKVYNSAAAIGICDDKSLTHLCLEQNGIVMPDTVLAPMTFQGIGYTNYDFLDRAADKLGFPLVLKECFGSFGQQVYLIDSREQLLLKVRELGCVPMMFQRFVESSKGRDLRLQVVGDRVVAAMFRYSDQDFRANITNGGHMKPYEPDQVQIDLALACCRAIGLDFAGVDLLFGEKEEPIVCEVNSNAHFKNIYDCTGVNAAGHIIDYIIEKEYGRC